MGVVLEKYLKNRQCVINFVFASAYSDAIILSVYGEMIRCTLPKCINMWGSMIVCVYLPIQYDHANIKTQTRGIPDKATESTQMYMFVSVFPYLQANKCTCLCVFFHIYHLINQPKASLTPSPPTTTLLLRGVGGVALLQNPHL